MFEFLKNGKRLTTTDVTEEEVKETSQYLFSHESAWKQSLTVLSSASNDSGVYSCKATLIDQEKGNTPVRLYSDMVLDVRLKPKIADFPQAPLMIKNATSKLLLECKIESTLNDTEVFWK